MPLRRIFLLGAAGLASLAALVAIVAVLSGNFGETEGRIFATIAATFVGGSTVIAAIAFLARGASPPIGYVGLALAVFGYLLWAEEIWAEHDSDRYWEFLGIVLAWTLAALIAMTNRLLLHSPRLVRTLYPATAAMAVLAALTVTVMVLRENGDGWQLFAIFVILALLGEVLAPILDRYAASDEEPSERLLGTVGGVSVLAVRGDRGAVRIGNDEIPLRDDERVVVRANA
jgi:FtsH-binding integral membrane protein